MLLGMTGAPNATTRGQRAVVTILLLAVGLALLAWMVRRLDLKAADVQTGFSAVGYWFGAILLLTLIRFGLRSYAWMALTRAPVPFGAALAATISGDALGNVTPLGLVASEPAKALYLRQLANPADTFASLTAENFFYSVSVAIYVAIGGAATLAFFDLPRGIHLAAVASLVSMAAVLAASAWLAWQKPALISGLLSHVPIARLRQFVDAVRTFEEQTYGAVGHAGSRLAVVSACEVGFHLLSLLECWLTFWLLTGVVSPLPALVFDGFNRVVNVVFKMIPMRLGVEESGTALLAEAIGLVGHDGFMLGLVRKVRAVVWVGVGLALWTRRR
jgi:hypothetical protein